MMGKRARSISFLAAACLLASVADAEGPTTVPTTAPTGRVENPMYAGWAKQKVGSSAHWAMEGTGPDGKKITGTATLTLKGVADDAVTIESVAVMDGQSGPPVVQRIPATVDAGDVRRTGTADVQSLGKTFKCDSYDVAQSVYGTPGSLRMTAYTSNDVVGGMVKGTTKLPWGSDAAITLTAEERK